MSRRRAATTSAPSGWEAISESVRGSSHVRSGLPNQDAVAVRALLDAADSVVVAAVADGHGGQRYVRSDVGSKVAVAVATELGADLVGRVGAGAGPKAAEKALSRLSHEIVERWRAKVLDHLATRPFTPEEHAIAAADLDVDPLISYGCTLILVILAPTYVALLQVGDGDALVVASDGSVTDPVPGDDRLVGGETTSLCLPTAVADARTAVLPSTDVELVVLSSDGYGNSFASEDWRRDAGLGFLDALRVDGLAGVEPKLAGWLADSAQAGGDDVSMVVAHRPMPDRARPKREPKDETTAGKQGGGRAGALLATVAVIALVVGGAVGWLAHPQDTDAATAEAPAVPVGEPDTTPVAPTTTVAVLGAVSAESILLPGKVVTFNPVLGGGEVNPTVTLTVDDDSIAATTTAKEGSLVVEVITRGNDQGNVRFDGGSPLSLGQPAVSVRIIDGTVWVASAEALRAFDAQGKPLNPIWSPLTARPAD